MDENKKEGGLRLKGFYKKSLPEKPLITVVTVCLNNSKGLEKTVRSVINQSYDNIEFLIVDGGSTDGSIEFIREHNSYIDYWVSEPDDGIYHGMNKGVRNSAGEWIIFMNSGDTFFSDIIVQNVVGKIDRTADVVYGGHIYRKTEYGDLRLHIKPGRLEDLGKGMVFSHQAMFAKSYVLKEKEFDCNYKILADYDLVLKLYQQKYRFQEIDEIIAVVVSGGESYLKRKESRGEYISILKRYKCATVSDAYLSFVLVKTRIVNIIEKFLPQKVLCVLYWLKHGQFMRILKERKNILLV